MGGSASAPSGERAPGRRRLKVSTAPSGTVTFLFTDIEGSTRLLERLRGRYADLLAEHRQILRDAFARWNGHEVDTQGDSFFVAFAKASDAVSCAVESQRELAAAIWPEGVVVKVRMGIHTGEPLVGGGTSVDYVGMDVHRAARIAAAGHGGQILVSATTHDIVTDALPSEIKLTDLGAHRLKDMRADIVLYQVEVPGLAQKFAPLVTALADDPPPTPGEAPYRGLEAFDERDADMFFGREEIVAQLAERVRGARFVALIGASGSGKSSILRAGVIPRLRANGTASRVLLLTPTAHPLEELAGALEPDANATRIAALTDELRADPRTLAVSLRTQGRDGPRNGGVLIAVDQLEEVFTLCRKEDERRAFISALVHAAGVDEDPASTPVDTDRARVVVTLRADFYAYLAPYPELRAAAAESQLYVGAMSPDELRHAIEEPARIGGWNFTPGLVDLLLRDVGDEPGALPLLSHALLETWQRRRGATMTLNSYAESGGVKGAIARTADRVYDIELSDSQRRIARDVFVRLTELGEGSQDTRRRASLDELIPAGASHSDEVRTVIKALADARLVTVGEDTVEVAHEALIREWPTLRDWLRADRDNLRIHRRLTEAAAEWEVAGKDESLLFRGARLAQARESTTYKGALNPLEQSFLDASVEVEERQQAEREAAERRELEAAQALAAEQSERAAEAARSNTRLRRRALLLTGVLALAAVLAGVAVVLARQSDENASLAASRAQEAQDNAALADQRAQEASANASLAADAAQQAQVNETAAQDQARQARAQRLGADANQVLLTGREPELAALLALTGLDTGYTAQADGALQRASRQISGTVFRHDGGEVSGVAVTPDGGSLFAAVGDKVHIWNVASGEELGQLEVPGLSDDPYVQITLSNDGSVLVVGDYYSPVAAYRIDPSQPQNAVRFGTDCPYLTGDAIRAMSGDGQVVSVFTDATNAVQFVHLADCTLFGSTIEATALNDPALNEDGSRFVASVNSNVDLIAWDVATGRALASFPHLGTFWHASFSPDGSEVAVGTFEGAAQLFNVESGQLIRAFGGHDNAVERAIVTPDGKLLSSSQDGTARLWDVQSGSEIRRFAHTAPVRQSVMTADGQWIYTASEDGTVRGWIASGERSTYSAGDGEVKGLSFSADGTLLASAAGGRVKVFDTTLGATSLDVPVSDARMALFSPTGDSIYAVSGLGTSVLDGVTGAVTQTLNPTANVAGSSSAGSLSADGTRLLAPAPGTNGVYLYDTAARDPLQIYAVDTAALSADGRRIVGFFPGRYSLYDATSGSSENTVSLTDTDGNRDTGGRPVDVELTPDGSRIVSGDHDNVVRVRNAETGEIELEMSGHGGPIKALRVSSDGKLALSASYDGGARLWDLETGKLLRYFPGHEGLSVTSVAISPDSQTVAIGSADGSVIIAPTSIDSLTTDVCSSVERELTPADRTAYGLTNEDQPCP